MPPHGGGIRVAVTCKWYHRAWSVVLLLFLVLGPFGLPFLWRSASFSRGMKLTLTIVVLAYLVSCSKGCLPPSGSPGNR